MCGIAGIVGTPGAANLERMRRMRDRMIHRGPDSAGEVVSGEAVLGVRRLRVIDLVTGDQPKCNENGTVWTVFNGEIYNFAELRDELAHKGHRFTSASDTEVIVHLYEDHGADFVRRLDGMFALAVWDRAARILVLARDRLGKKPLLYAERGREILFASEHAALLEGASWVPEVEPRAIRMYLHLGYIPAPYDAFRGVVKLRPGHLLVWREGRAEVRPYWSLPDGPTLRIDRGEAAAEVRRLVERGVARRLVADVPIGAFLSGGIDSSVVVAAMVKSTPLVRTFTIGFDDDAFSEIGPARLVADHFGTQHHELVVRPLEVDVLPDLVRRYGEPYADSSALPTFHLARLTRQHVTVALNGDGGDEVFAGYDRYRATQLASLIDRAGPIRSLLSAFRSGPVHSRVMQRVTRFMDGLELAGADRYFRWVQIFDERRLSGLLTLDFAQTSRRVDPSELWGVPWRGSDDVASAQRVDFGLYLPDDLLVKVDIASMANSLEVRSPLLDRELVEFVSRLPTALKVSGFSSKRILKDAFADVLPGWILRRPKHGFGVPISSWLRGPLRDMAHELVLSPRAAQRGYFREDALRALVSEHVTGRSDHGARLWSLMMLEIWHREVIEASHARADARHA